jgi:hypothetical protein
MCVKTNVLAKSGNSVKWNYSKMCRLIRFRKKQILSKRKSQSIFLALLICVFFGLDSSWPDSKSPGILMEQWLDEKLGDPGTVSTAHKCRPTTNLSLIKGDGAIWARIEGIYVFRIVWVLNFLCLIRFLERKLNFGSVCLLGYCPFEVLKINYTFLLHYSCNNCKIQRSLNVSNFIGTFPACFGHFIEKHLRRFPQKLSLMFLLFKKSSYLNVSNK